MPHYRLRMGLMDALEFECNDDEAAKGHAEMVLGGGRCGELWRRVNWDPPLDANGHAREPR